ncbi:MAG: hypothetical protein WA063_01745, partial [Minisyncoccia bacterium]
AWDVVADKIFYSSPTGAMTTIGDTTLDGATFITGGATQVTEANLGSTSGSGWIPVNLNALASGSPVSNFPIDPTNSIAEVNNVANTDLVYRYACHLDNLTYEINARLESSELNQKMASDGGNNGNMYEVGTKLDILGDGSVSEF